MSLCGQLREVGSVKDGQGTCLLVNAVSSFAILLSIVRSNYSETEVNNAGKQKRLSRK